MFVLAFSSFIRFSELLFIRSKDVHFGEGFISVFIEKSKADQLRQGQPWSLRSQVLIFVL